MVPIVAPTPVAAWLQAAQHLLAQPKRRASRIFLEIENPIGLPPQDRAVYGVVDRFLLSHGGLPINTVANTIFPWGMYRRHGWPALYEEYLAVFPQVQRDCDARQWGTYFHRLIQRRDHTGSEIRPLPYLIEKLNKRFRNRAAYELSPVDLFLDIPVYDARLDKHYPLSGPCLSHLSFSLTEDRALDLTAHYRSHFYVQRALGNLIGLAHLMQFVAEQTELRIGVLACVSNTAQLDTKIGGWGNRDI
jgi:hypothetical protein